MIQVIGKCSPRSIYYLMIAKNVHSSLIHSIIDFIGINIMKLLLSQTLHQSKQDLTNCCSNLIGSRMIYNGGIS